MKKQELQEIFHSKVTINKGISSVTASRDLKQLLEKGIVVSSGNGRMTKYKKSKWDRFNCYLLDIKAKR